MNKNYLKKIALILLLSTPAVPQVNKAGTSDLVAGTALITTALLAAPHIKQAAKDVWNWMFWNDANYINWVNLEIAKLEKRYGTMVVDQYYFGQYLSHIVHDTSHALYNNYTETNRTYEPIHCALAFVQHDKELVETIIQELIQRKCYDQACSKALCWINKLMVIEEQAKGALSYQLASR